MRTANETRLLDLHRHHITRILDAQVGTYRSYSWLAIRLSNIDTVAREGTIALASAFEAQTAGSQSTSLGDEQLVYYNRAISATRSRLRSLSKQSPHANLDSWFALLITIMHFVCIELLYCNVDLAWSHLHSYLQIIQQNQLEDFEVGAVTGTFRQLGQRFKLSLHNVPHFETFTRDVPNAVEPLEIDPNFGPLHFTSQRQITQSWYSLLAEFLNLLHDAGPSDGQITLAGELAIRHTISRIEEWCSALEIYPSDEPSSYHISINEYKNIMTAHARTMILRLNVRLTGGGEAHYDHFTDSFEAIMALIRAVPPFCGERQGTMWYHVSTLASAFFVAVKCREPGLRREAISRMQQWATWRGPWHGRAMGCAVAKRILELDEGGRAVASAGDVAVEHRLRDVRVRADPASRCVRLRFLVACADGRFVEMEERVQCEI